MTRKAWLTEINEDPRPTTEGWYAVTQCWDSQEGLIPGAEHWPWARWEIIAWSPTSFPTKEEAVAWAYDNDMEDPE